MTSDTLLEFAKIVFTALVTGFLGYTVAAFRKASKHELKDLEVRLDAKLRERQTLIIDPIKAQLVNLEGRLSETVTARELDSKFDALGRRLDDIVALIGRKERE